MPWNGVITLRAMRRGAGYTHFARQPVNHHIQKTSDNAPKRKEDDRENHQCACQPDDEQEEEEAPHYEITKYCRDNPENITQDRIRRVFDTLRLFCHGQKLNSGRDNSESITGR